MAANATQLCTYIGYNLTLDFVRLGGRGEGEPSLEVGAFSWVSRRCGCGCRCGRGVSCSCHHDGAERGLKMRKGGK